MAPETEALAAAPLAALCSVRHGFFTREGGVSEGVYGSLNCGFGSGDETHRIVENRRRVALALASGDPAPNDVLTPSQWHSAEVKRIEAPFTTGTRPKVDSLVSTTPGVAIGVLTADCGPVLFADNENGVIAAAHAGWRGAIGGVLEATVREMEATGGRTGSIHAVLGPCISQSCYEVGPEFRDRFLAEDPDSDRFFMVPEDGARPRFDLAGFITGRLELLGLASVTNLGACTYSGKSRFFSFRRATHRSEPDYGRQISAIVLR